MERKKYFFGVLILLIAWGAARVSLLISLICVVVLIVYLTNKPKKESDEE